MTSKILSIAPLFQLHVSAASGAKVSLARQSVPCTDRSATVSSHSSLANIQAHRKTNVSATVCNIYSV